MISRKVCVYVFMGQALAGDSNGVVVQYSTVLLRFLMSCFQVVVLRNDLPMPSEELSVRTEHSPNTFSNVRTTTIRSRFFGDVPYSSNLRKWRGRSSDENTVIRRHTVRSLDGDSQSTRV